MGAELGGTSGEQVSQAHKAIEKAKLIVFLGFGYNPTNVKRLIPDMRMFKLKDLETFCISLRAM